MIATGQTACIERIYRHWLSCLPQAESRWCHVWSCGGIAARPESALRWRDFHDCGTLPHMEPIPFRIRELIIARHDVGARRRRSRPTWGHPSPAHAGSDRSSASGVRLPRAAARPAPSPA